MLPHYEEDSSVRKVNTASKWKGERHMRLGWFEYLTLCPMHSEWIIQIHDQIYLTPKLVSSSHRTLLHTTLYHFLNE